MALHTNLSRCGFPGGFPEVGVAHASTYSVAATCLHMLIHSRPHMPEHIPTHSHRTWAASIEIIRNEWVSECAFIRVSTILLWTERTGHPQKATDLKPPKCCAHSIARGMCRNVVNNVWSTELHVNQQIIELRETCAETPLTKRGPQISISTETSLNSERHV